MFVEVRSRSDDHTARRRDDPRTGPRRPGRDSPPRAVEPVFDECRFDIVAITAGEPILIKDAFRVR